MSDEREEQRNLAERRLDESNAIKTLLQEVLDSSLSGISALDAIRNSEGKIVDFTFSLINKKGNELLNKDGVGLFGKHLLSELPSFRDIGLFDMFVLVAEEGQDFYVERLYRGDGLERWFSINCVKHNDGVVATFIDITETKRAEQERMLFEKSRRMTVLELLENLSHQWRQPLNTISMSAQNIEDMYDGGELDEEGLKGKLSTIVDTSVNLSKIISMFSKIYAEDRYEGDRIKLIDCVKKALELSSHMFETQKISYDLAVDDSIGVKALQSDMIEVLLAILINVGDIARRRQVVEPHIKIVGKKEGEFALLEISDNCGGVDEEILPKIFDPYVTTEFKSYSKGLGLFIVKNIVELRLGGFIEVHNKNGGAEFLIRLAHD